MGDGVKSGSPTSFTQIFDECFPYYLSIGMTYAQFWSQDHELVKAYRRAEKIRIKRQNEQAWLQGAYFYSALCSVAPILHAFTKNGTRPIPYMEKPISIMKETSQIREEEEMTACAEGFRALVEAKNAERRRKKKEAAKNDY